MIKYCIACKKWEVTPEDLYCSWCGELLTRLSLVHDVIPFYPEAAGEELQGALKLRNDGTRPVDASVVVPAGFRIDAKTVHMEPGDEPLEVPFSFKAPFTANWMEVISVQVQGGSALQAKVVCGAAPEFALEPASIAVVEGQRTPLTVTLRHLNGGAAFISSITSTTGQLEVLGGSGRVQPGGELAFQVVPAGGSLTRGESIEDDLEIEVLNYDTLTYPLELRALRPPQLEVSTDTLQFGDVMPGRKRTKVVRISNQGEAPLTIHQVSLVGADDRWKLTLSQECPADLKRLDDLDINMTISGDRPGPAEAKLLIVSNDLTQPELHVRIQADVLANPVTTKTYVGIDFGTTHSCICVARPGEKSRLLVLDEAAGNREDQVAMPSCVWWPQPPQPGNLRDCVVGRQALEKAQSPVTSRETVVSVKRRMGDRLPIRMRGVSLMPQDVAARIIRYMVDAAEDYLGAVVKNAVVTVPANFTPPQVRATVEACRLAGIDAEIVKKHMMDEPVGAAVDWLKEHGDEVGNNFHALVYDFGGGTLDISIIRTETVRDAETGLERQRMMVVASKGDNNFGGDDLTELLRLHLKRKAEEEFDGVLLADPPEKSDAVANAQLRSLHNDNYTKLRWKLAEKMKRQLSTEDRCTMGEDLTYLVGRETKTEYVTFTVTRQQYEDLIREKIESSHALVDRALRAAGLREDQIPLVLLVGMSSRTPLVRQLMKKWFGMEPELHPEPKACVARGAHLKGQRALLPQADAVTELVRELNQTNCRYGIIALDRRLRARFQTIVAEGLPFPAAGNYPQPLVVSPGMTVVVALNRGDDDSAENNPDLARLGEIVVDEVDGDDLPLEVTMTVADHRNLDVTLRVNGRETPAARFEQY